MWLWLHMSRINYHPILSCEGILLYIHWRLGAAAETDLCWKRPGKFSQSGCEQELKPRPGHMLKKRRVITWAPGASTLPSVNCAVNCFQNSQTNQITSIFGPPSILSSHRKPM